MATRRKNNGDRKKRRILGVLISLLAVLLMVSLATHSGWDNDRIQAQDNPFRISFDNQVGIVGAYSSYLLQFFLGWLAFFLPLILALVALRLFELDFRHRVKPAFWAGFVIAVMVTMITDVYLLVDTAYGLNYTGANGGYITFYLTVLFIKVLGATGSYLLLGAGIITCLLIIGHAYDLLSPLKFAGFGWLAGAGRLIVSAGRKFGGMLVGLFHRREGTYEDDGDIDDDSEAYLVPTPGMVEAEADEEPGAGEPVPGKRARKKVTVKKKTPSVKPAPIGQATKDFNFPGLELLEDNPESDISVSPDELNFTARALKDTLETFDVNIQGQIEYFPGPVITRYEFKPAAGVKVNRIINLSDDLALALKARRIRIVAPIPGKAAVGIEIPNRKIRTVYLKDIISSPTYTDRRLRLPMAFGKTISGKPYVADLARMPHLLIAGATGSGKSVCINGIITSMLYRLHPRDLKFIFIDPKMLELSVYAGIPHLGRPVVTNAKRAEKVLSDAVVEMEKRYKKLASVAVRNIDDFNARQKDVDDRMPYIVIIVDELADLMIAASSSRIEMLITRLAQMARAVGIHLILATQRPSVDVITGLIKANFSARVAFQVATRIDSRTILDGNGAEKLLGKGDMLFLEPGQPEPIRLHGAFVSGIETEKLVNFILEQFPQEEKSEAEGEEEEKIEDVIDLDDPLFIEAAQTCIRHKQGSVSLLQRKLGIGYQRAARLIDKLEDAKIVSTYDGSKAREVLVDKAFLDDLLASRSLTGGN